MMTTVRGSARADVMLLLAAGIWGFAFVAQRVGMEHVGPFTFNGIRFALGSLAVLPLIRLGQAGRHGPGKARGKGMVGMLKAGILAGGFLLIASSLQQVGIVYTTAGNAGFITGIYVVLVPAFGLLAGRRTGRGTALGAVLAFVGLYLLSVRQGLVMGAGDMLVLISAFFWTGHVLIIGELSRRMNPGKLAAAQYAVVSLCSLAVALPLEGIDRAGIVAAAVPLLYGGLASVGVAYSLQIIGQRTAHPAHAAIILSLEAVFAALGGWLILGETLSGRGILGAGMMLAGMVASQIWGGTGSQAPGS